jgi:branched-chain amino acid transport system permease protein
VRARLLAVLASCLLVLLVAPSLTASAAAVTLSESPGELLQGTLEDPDDEPVRGVTITVEQGGREIGQDTTDRSGAWQVELPGPGVYEVVLDTSTLPKDLQLRNRGGERLPDVQVSPGLQRTVIFPLIPASQQQEPAPGEATASPSPGAETGEDGGGTPAIGGPNFGERFAQLFLEGIKFGAIIAITAVGLSLVFGTTRLINFAHGELVTIGAISAFWLSTSPGNLPLWLAAIGAIVLGALLGGAMEAGLWRPMRKRGSGLIQMFIISIGLALLLRHVILVVQGSRRQQYNQYNIQEEWQLGPFSITPRDLVVTLLSIVVLLGVAYMLQRTRIGKATRAVADNRDLAESSGIDVNRVVLIVWMIGGGLAALGGVLYGLTQAIYWDMGFNLLLLMFAGVILGGLGSAYGAMVGSFVVGLVAQLSTLWFPVELQNAWALLVLIVVLVVRPQGILGRAERAG